MESKTLTGLAIGLATGVIIGGVVALLYAPKSGKETRQLIKDKATEVVDTLKEDASGVMVTVKDAASEASRKSQAAVKALKS
jgi:gas vesicle protein